MFEISRNAKRVSIALMFVGLSFLYLSFEMRFISYFLIYITLLFGFALHVFWTFTDVLRLDYPNVSNIAGLILRYVLVLGATFGYGMQLTTVYDAYLCLS